MYERETDAEKGPILTPWAMVRVSHWPCHYVVPRSSFDLFDVFIYVMYTSAHKSSLTS